MSEDAFKRLEHLRDAMGATTIAEAVRRSIEMGELVTDFLNKGYSDKGTEGQQPRKPLSPTRQLTAHCSGASAI
jgi:hypothetical protein